MTLHELEMKYIVRLLDQNEGNKPETAKQLGVSLKTLYNKLNSMQESQRHLAG
jgi:DNA-binding NtrC family response regulator